MRFGLHQPLLSTLYKPLTHVFSNQLIRSPTFHHLLPNTKYNCNAYQLLLLQTEVQTLERSFATDIPITIPLHLYMEMGYVLNYILFLLPIFLTFILVRKSKKIAQTRAKLPPGSMGWPYIGETLELYSQDPNDFFAAKQKRFAVSTRFFFI